MNQNETGATEQPLNAPENSAPQPKEYGLDEVAAIVAKQFLGGTETADSKESETQSKDAEPQPEAGEDQQDEGSLTAENEEETVAEADDEPEQEASEDDEVDRGLPKGVKKRIDKLTAKRREAEAKIAEMEQEMERLKQEASKKEPARGPDPLNPYAHLSTPDEISKEMEQAKKVRRWCEMNPDGATVKGDNGEEVDYTSEEVRQIKLRTMDALEEHLPKQMQYVNALHEVDKIANVEYPWWKDKTARERHIADKFLEAFPEIKRFPDYKMVVGDYIRGVKARETSKQKTVTNKAPIQPRPTSAPVKATSKDAALKAAQNRFQKTGSTDDLASIIASKFI